MSPKFETNLETLRRQVVVETYKSSGPGGQRKNKTETAVRLTHLPTGMTVVATEHRSQAKNRELAFQRLQERLARLNRPRKRRIPTRASFGAVEARLTEKKAVSSKKRLRKRPSREEG